MPPFSRRPPTRYYRLTADLCPGWVIRAATPHSLVIKLQRIARRHIWPIKPGIAPPTEDTWHGLGVQAWNIGDTRCEWLGNLVLSLTNPAVHPSHYDRYGILTLHQGRG